MSALPKAKTAVFILLGLLIAWFLFYVLSLILEPGAGVKNLRLTNQADHQITISWTTDKATRGSIILSRSGKFPLLSSFARVVNKDDGDKGLNKQGYYTTHSVTIGNLSPNTSYYFKIYQGQKQAFSGRFKTVPTLTNLTSPHPVYGRVLMSDGKTPLIGAIVYLQVKGAGSSASSSAVLSSLTNTQGRWSLDLGNLRNIDLKSAFSLPAKFSEMMLVEGGSRGRSKAVTTSDKDQPWPDVILNK